jgi:hypothetical protein
MLEDRVCATSPNSGNRGSAEASLRSLSQNIDGWYSRRSVSPSERGDNGAAALCGHLHTSRDYVKDALGLGGGGQRKR